MNALKPRGSPFPSFYRSLLRCRTTLAAWLQYSHCHTASLSPIPRGTRLAAIQSLPYSFPFYDSMWNKVACNTVIAIQLPFLRFHVEQGWLQYSHCHTASLSPIPRGTRLAAIQSLPYSFPFYDSMWNKVACNTVIAIQLPFIRFHVEQCWLQYSHCHTASLSKIPCGTRLPAIQSLPYSFPFYNSTWNKVGCNTVIVIQLPFLRFHVVQGCLQYSHCHTASLSPIPHGTKLAAIQSLPYSFPFSDSTWNKVGCNTVIAIQLPFLRFHMEQGWLQYSHCHTASLSTIPCGTRLAAIKSLPYSFPFYDSTWNKVGCNTVIAIQLPFLQFHMEQGWLQYSHCHTASLSPIPRGTRLPAIQSLSYSFPFSDSTWNKVGCDTVIAIQLPFLRFHVEQGWLQYSHCHTASLSPIPRGTRLAAIQSLPYSFPFSDSTWNKVGCNTVIAIQLPFL